MQNKLSHGYFMIHFNTLQVSCSIARLNLPDFALLAEATYPQWLVYVSELKITNSLKLCQKIIVQYKANVVWT